MSNLHPAFIEKFRIYLSITSDAQFRADLEDSMNRTITDSEFNRAKYNASIYRHNMIIHLSPDQRVRDRLKKRIKERVTLCNKKNQAELF